MTFHQQHASLPVAVGLAFLHRKLLRILTPELRGLASSAGLQLVALDPHQPLDQQASLLAAAPLPTTTSSHAANTASTSTCTSAMRGGAECAPFVIVLHKLHADPVWEAHLAQYVARHPHVRVLDPPAAIHNTEDRALMLAAIPPGGLLLRLPATATPTSQSPTGPSPQNPIPCMDTDADRPGPRSGSCSGSGSHFEIGFGSAARDGDGVRMVDSGCGGGGSDSSSSSSGGCGNSRCEVVVVRAPEQVVVHSCTQLRALAAGGEGSRAGDLQPPLILKTQRADAAGGSGHGLAVALTWDELLDKAMALQAAAAAAAAKTTTRTARSRGAGEGGGSGADDHDDDDDNANAGDDGPGGWVPLLVYVLGEHVQVTRRSSLTLSCLSAMRNAPSPAGKARREQDDPQPSQPSKLQSPASASTGDLAAAAGTSPADGAPAPPLVLQHLSAQPQPGLHAPDAIAEGDGVTAQTTAMEGATGKREVAEMDGPGGPAISSGGGLGDQVLGVVAQELSHRMGLTMFNFDVVMPTTEVVEGAVGVHGEQEGARAGMGLAKAGVGGSCVLYVIDVNYFPGYDKLQGWETHLVAHLRAAAEVARARPGV
ncbi:hypothetical protein VOLCADRAFT_89931 [Volvox carteri f. nagariensis]|uniref:Inositol-tetrakisphosphate 1-kinase N-terminal domain-containing protein n=1 Tax=Volvox carteri f. nagariensis TaxID=3068 RepID=D8TT15_VOLCA|nr:uncharacterized protein VOLCADRAFT_89931 [Volvox carteri f. nagariensis]EFJ49575.1 hypothetical protein VOLCADRAFT_89931 [Volvox carteri f. nagariensis]|eukprot:XP_002949556.1 hypothetical protein VOLCADRAFT_89931 [Volvox carteri f. nagariensis]